MKSPSHCFAPAVMICLLAACADSPVTGPERISAAVSQAMPNAVATCSWVYGGDGNFIVVLSWQNFPVTSIIAEDGGVDPLVEIQFDHPTHEGSQLANIERRVPWTATFRGPGPIARTVVCTAT